MINTDQFPKYDPQIYTRVGLNDLVIHSIYQLSKLRKEIATEDIVAACYLMFPRRFALRGYDQWPDSSMINKRWVDCRNKGFITGSTARGFSITPKGLEFAEKVEKILKGKRPLGKKSQVIKVGSDLRTRAGRFVRSIEKSDAFKSYKGDGEMTQINEFDFRSMLLCTLDSSAKTLKNNLDQFKQYVDLYDRGDLAKFLIFCEKKFTPLLNENSSDKKKYSGGMMRRKLTDNGDPK